MTDPWPRSGSRPLKLMSWGVWPDVRCAQMRFAYETWRTLVPGGSNMVVPRPLTGDGHLAGADELAILPGVPVDVTRATEATGSEF
ncbi:MAG TPA: hypothetical protein VLW50_07235 [Streptosporangiaceae bacterium]|nr:hypothetical protein [Streptosporangiaceae bacterium]